MQATRKTAPPLALAALTLAAMQPQAARAQSLTLQSGDAVTVNGSGTHGTYGGAPISNSTTSYDDSRGTNTAVRADGTSTFTLGAGGALTARDGDYGLVDNASGQVTVTGGTITAGADGTALLQEGSGPVTISGGTFTAGRQGMVLFAGGTSPVTISGGTFAAGVAGFELATNTRGAIDLYGSFTGYAPGTTTALPGGQDTFFGTLQNNTVGQTFRFANNGTITLHALAPAATPAPEPSSVAAFAFTGLGAAGLILKARRRKSVV